MALGLDLCSPRLCSAGDLRALLFVPLVLTNVFAISLICHKAWYVHCVDLRFSKTAAHFRWPLYRVNRKVVQPFTDCNSNNKSRAAYTLASLRTSRNLALLIETGILYIGLMVRSWTYLFIAMLNSVFRQSWLWVQTASSMAWQQRARLIMCGLMLSPKYLYVAGIHFFHQP